MDGDTEREEETKTQTERDRFGAIMPSALQLTAFGKKILQKT